MEKESIEYLSASRIKTLETCSWQYYCSYVLKLPQKGNDGSSRGTICHLVLELLLSKKHKSHFTSITKKGSIDGSEAVSRLVKKRAQKLKVDSAENLKLIDEMIVVGLKNEFFGAKGAKVLPPEFEFRIENERPKYNIRGFIDKPIDYPADQRMEITDYKSSKEKFKGEELKSNTQAMMYSLAAKKSWPDRRPIIKFVFLRFPKQPTQILEFSDAALSGFEHYLSFINKKINNFDQKAARSNFAADQPMEKGGGFKGPIVCGFAKEKGQLKKDGTLMWHCPVKFAFSYYVLKNENGEVVKSSFEDDLSPGKSETVEKLSYPGCPRFSSSPTKENQDPFDF